MNPVRQAILRAYRLCKDRGGGSLREYDMREAARAIDWRATARRETIQVRERDCTALTWGALVDSSRSMQAGRRRRLHDSAIEATAFWRACAAPADRWAEIDPTGRLNLSHALERALRLLPVNGALLAAGDFFELPPFAVLLAAARRFDCTALIARDPWHGGLPLAGLVTVSDLETNATRTFFVGSRERKQFVRAARAKEEAALAWFRAAGWRAVAFDENNGARAVLQAFGAA